jgi:hypothetical protein
MATVAVTGYKDVETEVSGTATGTKTGSATGKKTSGYELITVQRPKIIYFEFEGLRPNIAHWIFYDSRDVTGYCNTSYSLDDYNTSSKNSSFREPGERYLNETGFPTELGGSTGTPLYSDSEGKLNGFFYIQSNETLNFPTSANGLNFIAIDISTINRDDALSYAATKFYSAGQYEYWYSYTYYYTYTYTYYYSYTTTETVEYTYYTEVPDAPVPTYYSGGGDGGSDYSAPTIYHSYSYSGPNGLTFVNSYDPADASSEITGFS